MRDLSRFIIAAPLSFVMMFGTPILAQRGAGPATGGARPTARPSAPTPARPVIDITADALPRGFLPDDPEAVFRELSPPKKGEFETMVQYEARVGKRQMKPWYAFSVEGGLILPYDADKQQFRARLDPEGCVYVEHTADCSGRKALTLKSVTTSQREYKGSNAFGATTTIHEVNFDKYSLFLPQRITSSLQIDMSPEEAKEAKPYLALLVIAQGGSDGDLVASGISGLTATIDRPFRGTDHHYYLELSPRSIWAYNKKTGKVYHKFDNFATGHVSVE